MLVFHLSNHFSLVFALREWVEPPVASFAAVPCDATIYSDTTEGEGGEVLDGNGIDGCRNGHRDTSKNSGKMSSNSKNCNGDDTSSRNKRKIHRELLCARRGQRPTNWMDFTEARAIMLGWEGYKILALSVSSSDGQDSGAVIPDMKASLHAALCADAEYDAESLLQARAVIDLFPYL